MNKIIVKFFGLAVIGLLLIAAGCGDGGRSASSAPAVGTPTPTPTLAAAGATGAAPAASLTPVPTLGSGAAITTVPPTSTLVPTVSIGLAPLGGLTPAPAATLTPAPSLTAVPPTATSTPTATAPGISVYALPVLELMGVQTFPATWGGPAPHSSKYGLQYQPPTLSHDCKTIVAPADPLEYPACILQEVQGGRMTATNAVIAIQKLAAKYGTPNFEGVTLRVPNTQATIMWCPANMAGSFRPDFSRPLMDTAGDKWRDNLFILSAGAGGPERVVVSKSNVKCWRADIF